MPLNSKLKKKQLQVLDQPLKQDMLREYLEKILKAKVYEVAHESPLDEARLLSISLGNKILLKREDLQPVFSFKLRGAYNKIANLDRAERERGVICSSAGNHAQGVALAAQRLGIKAVVVMPTTTPQIKLDAVRAFNPEIVLHGVSYDDAKSHADALATARDLIYVHPFDDPEVIAGQGTVGMEILRQSQPHPDAIFVAVGGGGMIAGIAAYVKCLWPDIRIIGVEPEDAASLYAALQADRRVVLDQVGIFADGVAVKQVGAEPFRIARHCVDEVILVNTDEICAAIKDLYNETRSVAEPAGALGIAGVKRYCARSGVRGQTYVAIVSGANMNFDRLRHIAERAEIGERREVLFAVTIPEHPGSLQRFCEIIGDRAITEFNYRYADSQQARIFVGVRLSDGSGERDRLMDDLAAADYAVFDLSDNEMAKVHVRYMVGGRPERNLSEVLYRFYFPERPQALMGFLTSMSEHQWNISLFHYRNHGSDYGRVLMGIQVPPPQRAEFIRFLDRIGYSYINETDNPAYRFFLSHNES